MLRGAELFGKRRLSGHCYVQVTAEDLSAACFTGINDTGVPEVFRMEQTNMRILGLDFGTKTVGVAVCDPMGMIAQGVETITRKEDNKLRSTFRRIEELTAEYQIETIVLGYPKNMDDTVGERAKRTEEFAGMLERRIGLPVILWDERLTTVAADEILAESGVPASERKKVIDKVAAGIILQDYLDNAAPRAGKV